MQMTWQCSSDQELQNSISDMEVSSTNFNIGVVCFPIENWVGSLKEWKQSDGITSSACILIRSE